MARALSGRVHQGYNYNLRCNVPTMWSAQLNINKAWSVAMCVAPIAVIKQKAFAITELFLWCGLPRRLGSD